LAVKKVSPRNASFELPKEVISTRNISSHKEAMMVLPHPKNNLVVKRQGPKRIARLRNDTKV